MNSNGTALIIWVTLIFALFSPRLCLSQEALVSSSANADTFPRKSQESPIVLCYHQVRDWNSADSKTSKAFIIPVQKFCSQMKFLHDNGYHIILPDQWLYYIQAVERLPGKTAIITFDDGSLSQYINALPELDRYNFKAVFFIMTVTIGRSKYMNKEQIKLLSGKGHMIGCHTWDHHNVTQYVGKDWDIQLSKPQKQLEIITERQVQYFAYPNGLWNASAIGQLKSKGFKGAFQLAGDKSTTEPMFTIRRILVDGRWTTCEFSKVLKSFKP